MTGLRKDCQMRHENGNCNVIGGFCTAINDAICIGLHNAYDCGYCDGAFRARREFESRLRVVDSNDPLTLDELRYTEGMLERKETNDETTDH